MHKHFEPFKLNSFHVLQGANSDLFWSIAGLSPPISLIIKNISTTKIQNVHSKKGIQGQGAISYIMETITI